jgi:hypothetical protein
MEWYQSHAFGEEQVNINSKRHYVQQKRRACNTHTHSHTVSGRDPNPTQSNPSILQKKNRRDQEQLKSPRRPWKKDNRPKIALLFLHTRLRQASCCSRGINASPILRSCHVNHASREAGSKSEQILPQKNAMHKNLPQQLLCSRSWKWRYEKKEK